MGIATVKMDLEEIAMMVPEYPTKMYMRKREMYKQAAESYQISRNKTRMKEVLEFEKSCGNKDQTYKCFHHIHELLLIRDIAKVAHGNDEVHELKELVKAVKEIKVKCANRLSNLAVSETERLLETYLEKSKINIKHIEDQGDDEDEGIADLNQEDAFIESCLGYITNLQTLCDESRNRLEECVGKEHSLLDTQEKKDERKIDNLVIVSSQNPVINSDHKEEVQKGAKKGNCVIQDKTAKTSNDYHKQSTTIPYKNNEEESGEREQENTEKDKDLLSSICDESDIVNISFEIINID